MRAAVIRTEDITERQWELLYGQLSEARRQKADRIHLLAHRRESIAAGALLEWLLRQQGEEAPFFYCASANGKPFLIGRDGGRKTAASGSFRMADGIKRREELTWRNTGSRSFREMGSDRRC